ncbi:unnamed protein product [Didymodactylos carnosus]|uniref:Uncharacterized protein n=1 Tax=Didymodactylos carnosus TaxID=1234261 RepID=A0A8S2FLB1_9BILA|nr:unnamed protein product [Didymodactylos carnosus]CAF4291566.1 unnamed protein product [Didymodactylos carnosus]
MDSCSSIEQQFYRTLTAFNSGSANKNDREKACENIQILWKTMKPTEELIDHLLIVINGVLNYGKHWRIDVLENRPNNIIKNQLITSNEILKIYNMLLVTPDFDRQRLCLSLNVTLFNRFNYEHLYILAGKPTMSNSKYTHGSYDVITDITDQGPIKIEINDLQHVVHNIDDVLNILSLTRGSIHFKAFSNQDYFGPNLFLFLPVSPVSSIIGTSDSSLHTRSSYGNVRFRIPFRSIINQYPNAYCLGTRKLDKEYCHTILLANNELNTIYGFGEEFPLLNESSSLIHLPESTYWKRYRSKIDEAWDQIDFCIPIPDQLLFDPQQIEIKIDFIDHEKDLCIPSLKARRRNINN